MSITRSVNIVTASARYSSGSSVAIYIDSCLKGVLDTTNMSVDTYNKELQRIYDEESLSDRVVVLRQESANYFLRGTCIDNVKIFANACPTLLQDLPRD